MLEQIDKPLVIDADGTPVVRVAQPKPALRIVSETQPVAHSRLPEEVEAATAVSPPSPERKLRVNAKFPDWTPEEDHRLREVYAAEGRVDLLAKELGRTERAATTRARKLGITKPRKIKGGWCVRGTWSEAEDAILREGFKTVPARQLAQQLHRSRQAVYCRAHTFGLTGQQWSGAHRLALRIAFERGIAVGDLAVAVDRLVCTIHKYANNHGMVFGRRPRLAEPITLDGLLALRDVNVPTPKFKRDIYAARRRNTQGASGTAREAPGAASSGAAKSDKVSAPPRDTEGTSGANGERVPARREAARPVVPLQRERRTPDTAARTFQCAATPRHILYAERIAAARAHLESRSFSVRRHDRDEIIARWEVSGWSGLFSNDQLVALAVHHGLELRA